MAEAKVKCGSGNTLDGRLMSNVISREKLREVQLQTLVETDKIVSYTFGPQNSNTQIMTGDPTNPNTIVSEFTKDGHTVLKNIQYVGPIENSILAELRNITQHVVNTVGDGTTSAVKLSTAIFTALCSLETNAKRTPFGLMRDFNIVVEKIKERIKSHSREITIDDIYNIALISTNGNTTIADFMKQIYEQYGFDVFIDVGVSINGQTYTKEYDGMTLEVGYTDPVFANRSDGSTYIENPRIYYFADPIDTPEMVSLFEKIIDTNIIIPISHPEMELMCVPTVIVTPKLSRDMSSTFKQITEFLYGYSSNVAGRPPLLIIDNLGPYEVDFNDIANLCGIKEIHKYIDPKIQEADIEKGFAPTLDTVVDFYGECFSIEADGLKTKFVNPKNMFEKDENGDMVPTHTYTALLNFLENEYATALRDSENATVTGRLKRRINSLKSNMVEFLIGGIDVADRDSLRALVEDAVLNCRSAARNGVGYGANFEGLRAVHELANESINGDDKTLYDIIDIILFAYKDVYEQLYDTMDGGAPFNIVNESIDKGCPLNIVTKEYDGKVLTSIDADIVIIDAIAKIITIMFTANQAMVPIAALNTYR